MELDDIQIFPELRLPVQCLAGMREEIFLVGETEVARTVNGRSMVLTMPWGQKYGLRYVCDGEGRRLLPLDDLRLGTQITVHAATPRSLTITPGAPFGFPTRAVVPGSLHARDIDTDAVVPVTYDVEIIPNGSGPDRVVPYVEIEPRQGWTQVSYRPVLRCLVTGVVGFGSDVTGRRVNGTIELEEEFAP